MRKEEIVLHLKTIFGVQLTRKFNKGNKFLLCFIGIFSKYALVVPLKDKIGITIANAF